MISYIIAAVASHLATIFNNLQDVLTFCMFYDLSEAFDCVQHSILVMKLHHYGIRGRALNLLTSYLDDRFQRIDVNGKKSPGSVISMGVP